MRRKGFRKLVAASSDVSRVMTEGYFRSLTLTFGDNERGYHNNVRAYLISILEGLCNVVFDFRVVIGT